jgi:hypothetical protein
MYTIHPLPGEQGRESVVGQFGVMTEVSEKQTFEAVRYAVANGSTMFLTSGFAAVIIAIKFLIGAVIGLLVAALTFRSHLIRGRALRGAVFAGITYLLGSGLAGWADSHAAFQDGHRMNVAPWGEDLHVRNFIAENELAICVTTSALAAVLANVRSRKTSQ